MSRRSSLQSTRHRTRKRTKVRSTYKTGECLQFSVCLQALSCFFCVPEKRPRCGGRVSLDGVAARGLVNGAHRIQVIAWQSALLTGLRHGDHAHRYFSGIPAWRRGLLSALWHGDPSHRHLRAIPAWRTASRPVHDRQLTDALTGLRHGDPAHRYLSGILAWRRGLLSALWHGDPLLKHFWGRVACRRKGNRYP